MLVNENGLPREVIECDSKLAADEVREQWPDAVVDEDDARTTRVTVSGDVREEWLWKMEQLGTVDEPESFGQRELTEMEKLRIDFTKTNVFHARSCKAIGRGLDVDDWLAYYDPRCTVDEHREIYRRPAGEPETCRRMATPEEFLTASTEVSANV